MIFHGVFSFVNSLHFQSTMVASGLLRQSSEFPALQLPQKEAILDNLAVHFSPRSSHVRWCPAPSDSSALSLLPPPASVPTGPTSSDPCQIPLNRAPTQASGLLNLIQVSFSFLHTFFAWIIEIYSFLNTPFDSRWLHQIRF